MAAKSARAKVKKVVLAYSGGLDTSIILKWLQETYQAEVVTFTADLGQGEELEPARRKAEMLGIKKANIFVEDLREEFIARLRVPDVPGQCALRGRLPARHVDRAAADRQDADRDREEDRRRRGSPRRHRQGQRPGALRAQLLRAGAVDQDHRAVARVELQEPRGADRLCAKRTRSPSPRTSAGEAPFSVDANMLHSSSEGKVLEDPAVEAPAYVYQRTISPMEAPDKATDITDRLRQGGRGQPRRQDAVAGHAVRQAQRSRARQRHRPRRPGREPVRRHEVARRVRDAGRHYPARRAPRHRVRSRSTAARGTSRTS